MDLDVYVEQINEEVQEKFEEIKELEVKYDAPAEYYVEAPIKFSESDISIYFLKILHLYPHACRKDEAGYRRGLQTFLG